MMDKTMEKDQNCNKPQQFSSSSPVEHTDTAECSQNKLCLVVVFLTKAPYALFLAPIFLKHTEIYR